MTDLIDELHIECVKFVVGPSIYDEISALFAPQYKRLAKRLSFDGYDYESAFSAVCEYLVTTTEINPYSPIKKILIRDYKEHHDTVWPMTIESFRRYLSTTIHRHLLTLHPKGFKENLVQRSTKILSEPPYCRLKFGDVSRFFSESQSTDPRSAVLPTENQIRLAANHARSIPQIYQRNTFRESSENEWKDPNTYSRRSKIYDDIGLRTVLDILMKNAEGLEKSQLFDFFENLLTNYDITIISNDVSTSDTQSGPTTDLLDAVPDTPTDHLVVYEVAQNTWSELDNNEKTVIRMKLEGLTDDQIARGAVFSVRDSEVTRTGRWVHGVRQKAQEKIQNCFSGLDESELEMAWKLLTTMIWAHDD